MDALKFKDCPVKSRGVNITTPLDYIRKKRGTDGVNEFLAMMRPHVNLGGIDEKKWYPLYYDYATMEGASAFLAGDPVANAEAIGEYTSSNIGFLKFFVKFAMNPNEVTEKARDDYGQFYDGGKLLVLDNRKGLIRLKLEGMPYFAPFDHQFRGFLTGVMNLTRTRGFKVEMVEENEYRVTW